LQVRIEAWQKFDTADQTSTAVPLISDFLAKTTGLSKEQIHIVLHPIDLWRIGRDGQIIQ
jgi:phenylpyruvate tautomerase PptA (4-oxalocrotonate tautomerase family)